MPALELELYKDMLLSRRCEELIKQRYQDNDMKTPMHMSMGEEAAVVGVCRALGGRARTLGSYRSHTLYLCMTNDAEGFLGEMYGKVTGPAHGRGGSMHLLSPERGLLLTSAIVASQIPVAVGAAFADVRLGNDRVTAVFFGDGAVDEGAFFESLNVACLMHLPVFFVCLDNGYAVHTSAAARHGYADIAALASGFNCHVFASDSTDVMDIYELTGKALKLQDSDMRPCFLHLRYYRYLEHVGVNEDYGAGYRTREEAEPWTRRDPLVVQRANLEALGLGDEAAALEDAVQRRVESAAADAQSAPHPQRPADGEEDWV